MPLPPALQENNPFAEFSVETSAESANPFAGIDMPAQSDVRQRDANPFASVDTQPTPEIKKAPPLTLGEKVKGLWPKFTPDQQIAKAQNVYSIYQYLNRPLQPGEVRDTKLSGMSIQDVAKNYEKLVKMPEITGISPDISNKQFTAVVLAPAILTGLATNAVGTLTGLAIFAGLEKLLPIDKLIPSDTSDEMRTTIELIDLIAKGAIAHGIYQRTPGVVEAFTKNKLTEYNLPETIQLSKVQVRDIFQTGKLTTAEQQQLFSGLNLNLEQRKLALTQGVKIDIPAEKVVTMVDKPWWNKIKSVFGAQSEPKILTEYGSKPVISPGRLSGPDTFAPITPTPASVTPAEVKVSATPSIFGGAKKENLSNWIIANGGMPLKAIQEHLGKDWRTNFPELRRPGIVKKDSKVPDLTQMYEKMVNEGVITPLSEGEKESYTGGVGQYALDQYRQHHAKMLEGTVSAENQYKKELEAFNERDKSEIKPIEGTEISRIEMDLEKEIVGKTSQERFTDLRGMTLTFKTPQEANKAIADIEAQGGHTEITRVTPEGVEVSSTIEYKPTPTGEGKVTKKQQILALGFDESWDYLLSPKSELKIIKEGLRPEDVVVDQEGEIKVVKDKGISAKGPNPFAAIDVQPTMPPTGLRPKQPQTELPLMTELQYGLSPQVQKTIFDNANDAEAKLKVNERAGRVLLPSGTAEGIKDPKLRAVLYAGRKKLGFIGSNLVNWLKDAAVSLFEGIKLEYEPTLREYPQLQDDIRTGPITFSRKAREQSELAIGGLVGNLNNYQEEMFLNIVGMQDLITRGGEGITLPQDLSVEQIKVELANQLQKAPQSVLDAVKKFDTLMKDVGMDLVAREKLGLDELKDNYFPHYVLEYMPAWWDEASAYLPKKLRKPYGAYLKKAVGSTKDIAITKEALAWHLSSVFMDNAIDDWAIEQLTKYDKVGLTSEQLDSVGPVKPNELKTITVNGVPKRYKGFQYVPGRHVYPVQVTNPKLIDKAIEEGMTVEEWQESVGPQGGAPVTQGLAMGRYNKVYLLPIEVYNRFTQLKTPWGDNPFLSLAMPATAQWKRITLDWAGIPFQAANFFGDFINLYRTAPGAAKEVGMSLHILKNLRTPDKLTPWQQKILKTAHDKDVLGAGFVQEYAHITPFLSPTGILEKIERFSSLREGVLRLAMLSYQMARGEVGLPFVAPEFSQYIGKLDKVSAAAYIARNFTVDYLAIPDWYRKWVRGFAAPFITFYQVNAKNWAKYVKNSPLGFIAKFLSVAVGLWAYNNTGDRKKIEERLPDYWRWRPFHVILKSEDLNKDGIPDRALIWAPQTPIEMAAATIGMDKVGDKITMIRAKRMTVKDAALQQMADMGLGSLQTVHSLLNPLIQFFEGVLSNRDPRTKQEVVPSELSNISENAKLPYRTRYFFEKMFTPYGQYLKEAKGTKPESWGILTGPLDITRAFGFYTVNLTSTDARIEMDANRKIRGDYDTYMYSIERRYLDGRDYSDIEKEAAANGIDIPSRSYDRLSSTRVQLEKVKEDMRNAKDALTKRRLEIEYDDLIKTRAEESIKTVPRGARQ